MNPDEVQIRAMKLSDVEAVAKTFCFPWSNQVETNAKWTFYAAEHEQKIRTVYLIEKQNRLIGYGSLLRFSEYSHFRDAHIPEIHDVWIAEEFRHHGYGKLLILHLEKVAQAEKYKQIGLGVGLYRDYGPAQILYTKLGYVPDGHGVTYKDVPITPGGAYPVDDELILWLTKPI